MTTKEYLMQISRLDVSINNKLKEINQLREMLFSLSCATKQDVVQTTPDIDKFGSQFSKIFEMETEINKMIDAYADKRKTIVNQIDSIEDETIYNVLFQKYIEKKNLENIAVDMNYSWRQIRRIHKKALIAFETKYGKEYL